MDTKKTTTNTGAKRPFTPRTGGAPFGANKGGPRTGGGDRGGRPGGKPGFNREKSEFDQKILNIRRVTRVVSGGRRMTFSVAMVIGDRKGSVGLGTGKAIDTALAIAKALKQARKNMVTLTLTKEKSLPYDVSAKFSSSKVFLMPNRGRGIVAGSAIRDILALAGVKNVTSKINSGSKNKLNITKATLLAFKPFSKNYTGKSADAFSSDANVGSEDKSKVAGETIEVIK